MSQLRSKRSPVRWAAPLCVLFAVGVLLTGGAANGQSVTQSKTAAAQASTTLTWALGTNPLGIWGPYCFCTSGSAVMSLVYQTQLAYSTFGQLTPQVIASWKQTNPTTYVYHVRPGVKFSNGTTVTGSDVAFSLAVHLNPKISSREASFFTDVQRISSKGDTVTVRLKHPDQTWQYVPALETGYVYSKADYLKNPNDYGTPSALPIGTGPYKFQSWQPNSQIVLVRNPYWQGQKFPWNKIVVPIIPDPQSLLLALESGKIDGTFDVPATDYATWARASNINFHPFPSFGFSGFSVDLTDGPFRDVHVRRAIAYALDREGLVKALLYGAGKPINCIVPPGQFRSVLPASEVQAALAKIPSYTYDLAKARAELKQSAYPNGFTTTLNIPPNSVPETIGQNVAQALAQIGINLKLNLMPGPARYQIMLDHGPHLGLQFLNTGPDNPDPADFPATRWVSSQAVKGGLNFSNWHSPEIDQIVAKANSLKDRAQAARLILKGCQIEAQQVSYLPIYTFDFSVAVRQGLSVSSAIGPFYANVNWLQYLRVG